jgi:hypothetical protein
MSRNVLKYHFGLIHMLLGGGEFFPTFNFRRSIVQSDKLKMGLVRYLLQSNLSLDLQGFLQITPNLLKGSLVIINHPAQNIHKARTPWCFLIQPVSMVLSSLSAHLQITRVRLSEKCVI